MNMFLRYVFIPMVVDMALAGMAGGMVYMVLTLLDCAYAEVVGIGVFFLELIWIRYTDSPPDEEPCDCPLCAGDEDPDE